MDFENLIGMGGAPPGSPKIAKSVDKTLDGPMLIAAFAVIPLIFIEFALPEGHMLQDWVLLADALIWGAFVAEYVTMIILTKQPLEYSKRNWLNIVIIVASVPVVMPPLYAAIRAVRMLRALRAMRVLAAGGIIYRSVEKILRKNGFAYFLALTVLLMLVAGMIIPAVDPAVPTSIDGLWWSIVTTTSFGEFDSLVPSTLSAKALGAVVIVLGLGLISLLTANISAHFVEKDSADEFSRIVEQLNRIEKRLDKMERRR